MTSKNLKSAIWLALAVSATALAAGGPPAGKGGGGGGGEGEETATNNLSVPTILVGGTLAAAQNCGELGAWAGLAEPTGDPLTAYPIDADAYYYVQGEHKWQSECTTGVPGFNVFGAWGDNLTGSASLKLGSQIRVEMVLLDQSGNAGQGFEVLKLEPDALDRASAYGTLAEEAVGGGYSATAKLLQPVVYDADAKLSVKDSAGNPVVPERALQPEINATGKVVYGYNLRVTTAGKYTITFTMPNVIFIGCDAGAAGACSDQTATLDITVAGGGGKKGGGKP